MPTTFKSKTKQLYTSESLPMMPKKTSPPCCDHGSGERWGNRIVGNMWQIPEEVLRTSWAANPNHNGMTFRLTYHYNTHVYVHIYVCYIYIYRYIYI